MAFDSSALDWIGGSARGVRNASAQTLFAAWLSCVLSQYHSSGLCEPPCCVVRGPGLPDSRLLSPQCNPQIVHFMSEAMLPPPPKQVVHKSSPKTLHSSADDVSSSLDVKPSFDFKMTVKPVLKIDSDNYMLRGGEGPRPRSYSFTNGAPPRGSHHTTDDFHNHLDLDMFCVRETVSSLSSVNKTSTSPGSCALTLSSHSLFCSCQLTCCCTCASICSPDCHACFHNACVRFAAEHACQRNSELLPPITLNRDKVSQIFFYISTFLSCAFTRKTSSRSLVNDWFGMHRLATVDQFPNQSFPNGLNSPNSSR